ncbi:hypothetical protein KY321_02630, partial [Candidatus Woesearchaeota archaeon]|nr:hypothetical protein [Candidatus Woesearchaeota archaeon]
MQNKNKIFILLILGALLFYRPLLGILYIFFLPGFLLYINLDKNKKIDEVISFSIALSLVITVLNGFFLNTFSGLNFLTVFTSLTSLIVIFGLIYLLRKSFIIKYNFEFDKEKIIYILLIIISLSVLFLNTYEPHFDNDYPIHYDEWSRLLETNHIIEQETFNNRYNPQFVGHPDSAIRMNPGFQFILSQFYILSGVNQILFFKHLPSIFAVLTGFILFSLLKKIGNFKIGILAILFLSLLKTNDNTLGISFLVALTMTFPLLYSLFYSLHNVFKEKKSIYLLISSLIYFTILVIHEQTGAAFLPIIILYVLYSTIKLLFKDKKIIFTKKGTIISLISVIIPLFSLYVARELLWKGTFKESFNSLIKLIVWEGITKTSYPYNFILFYGTALSILAIIGIIFIYKKIDFDIFLIWSLIATGQVINFYF